jgi:outer membrane immunogenic protein
MVKWVVAGAVFAALLAGRATAADLVVPRYAAPVVVPVGWNGFCLGVNAGATWASVNDITIATYPATIISGGDPGIFVTHSIPAAASASGTLKAGRRAFFLGGGQAGYNWQLGSFVAGIESDLAGVLGRNRGTVDGATGVAFVGPNSGATGTPDITTFTASRGLDWLATLRGRFGYLGSPLMLAYLTGGLAFGSTSASAGFTTVNPAYPGIGLGGIWGASNFFSVVRAGWTFGGGLEWMFTPGWSAKAEYLYYDLGVVTTEIGPSGPIVLPGFAGAGSRFFTNGSTVSTRYSGNVMRLGLNYQLGSLPPFPRF